MPFSLSSFLLGLSSLHLLRTLYRLTPYLRPLSSAHASLLLSYPPSLSPILITGATDGIGSQLAHHFHSLNYPLILHGRNPNKLLALQKTIPTATLIHCDLKETNLPILEAIDKYNVRIFVNSAGVTRLDEFREHTGEDVQTLLKVNVEMFTGILQRFFKKSEQNHQKLFVNVCSLTATDAFPLLTLYGATKSYQQSLLDSLDNQHRLLGKKNQHILNVLPWYITTKMTGYRKTWDTEPPGKLVEGIVKLIVAGRSWGVGTVKHELISLHLKVFLDFFVGKLKEDYGKVLKIRKRRGK